MRDKSIPPVERVYCAVKYQSWRLHCTYARRVDSEIPLTQKELSTLLAIPVQTVNDSVKQLRDRGYMRRDCPELIPEPTPLPPLERGGRKHVKVNDPGFVAYFNAKHPEIARQVEEARNTLARHKKLERDERINYERNGPGLWKNGEPDAPLEFDPADPALGGFQSAATGFQSAETGGFDPPKQPFSSAATGFSSSVSLLINKKNKEEEEYIRTSVVLPTGAEEEKTKACDPGPPASQTIQEVNPHGQPEKNGNTNGNGSQDLFIAYWELFVRAGKALNDRDKEQTLRIWLGFDPQEQEKIIWWTAEQMRDRWSDELHTPLPQNNLQKQGWKRVATPRTVRGPEAASERRVMDILVANMKQRGY